MPDAVTDTHALIWYLQDDARLSSEASAHFDGCEHDGGRIRIASISLVEVIYLSEKGRIPAETLASLLSELRTPDTILEVVGLDLAVVLQIPNVPRSVVPDMPDRIIAATALALGLPLITRDAKIRHSRISTVW